MAYYFFRGFIHINNCNVIGMGNFSDLGFPALIIPPQLYDICKKTKQQQQLDAYRTFKVGLSYGAA
jgi:hypothetical protein